MTHTAIPSVKGQITIPAGIRKKYKIDQNTPLVIADDGNGVITMKIMRLAEHDEVTYYENSKEFGVTFKRGLDPQKLIDAIHEIDG